METLSQLFKGVRLNPSRQGWQAQKAYNCNSISSMINKIINVHHKNHAVAKIVSEFGVISCLGRRARVLTR